MMGWLVNIVLYFIVGIALGYVVGYKHGKFKKPQKRCTCHERDSSFTCQSCKTDGYYGHVERKWRINSLVAVK